MNEISGDEKERGSGRTTALAFKYAYLAIEMKGSRVLIQDHDSKIYSSKSLCFSVQKLLNSLNIPYEVVSIKDQFFITVTPILKEERHNA